MAYEMQEDVEAIRLAISIRGAVQAVRTLFLVNEAALLSRAAISSREAAAADPKDHDPGGSLALARQGLVNICTRIEDGRLVDYVPALAADPLFAHIPQWKREWFELQRNGPVTTEVGGYLRESLSMLQRVVGAELGRLLNEMTSTAGTLEWICAGRPETGD